MTAQPPSVVDTAQLTVRRTITISAPVAKVWAAVTQAEHLARWFPQSAVLDDLTPGARGVFTFDGYGQFPIVVEDVDEPRTIAYRWSNDNARAVGGGSVDPERSTVFRFTLEPLDGGTRLTVVETGFGTLADPAASLESNRGGWDAELDELIAYLEGGS